jgi:hypothetical protein
MPDDERLKEEVAKLGPNAAARIVAVQDFITAQVGPDLSRGIIGDLTKAQHVEGFEKLMSSYRTQQRAVASDPSPPPPAREPPLGPGRVDEETFAKMSARERFDYARQFPQPNDGGAGR